MGTKITWRTIARECAWSYQRVTSSSRNSRMTKPRLLRPLIGTKRGVALREDFLIFRCGTESPNCVYFQKNHEGIVVHYLVDHLAGVLVLDRRLPGLRLHHSLPNHRLHSCTFGEFEFHPRLQPASYHLKFLLTASNRFLTQVHSVPEVLRREHDGRKSTLLR